MMMGQVPTLRIPSMRKEITIKGSGGKQKGWGPPQQQTRGTRKSFSFHAVDQSFLKNSVHLSLIVKNTVITVVHILNPSSLARSLQIHCTGLTGLRSHASWAWPEKHDPTPIVT